MNNNEISLNLRLIASGTHMVGTIALILSWLLTQFRIMPSGAGITGSLIFGVISHQIIVLFVWKTTRHIHHFVDISGRDAINCALNTLIGTIASVLFCTFIFSITCGVGNQDPTLFFVSLFILSCVEIAYFINSVITGIFALRGYRFESRLIYPFVKSE